MSRRQGLPFGDYQRFLGGLGNPQLKLPVVLIAGSNGKGSTAAFLASIIEQAGYRVGLYTSPHLERLNERMMIGGRPISDEKLGCLLSEVDSLADACQLNFFQFLSTVMFRFFVEERVELAVLEVGLGGRLDPTNASDPLLSAITGISKEHGSVLGNTLLEILGEKLAIARKGRPLLLSERRPSLRAEAKRWCRDRRVPLLLVRKDFKVERVDQGARFQVGGEALQARPSLAGRHQEENALLALAMASLLNEHGYVVNSKAMTEGVANTVWPGRLEQHGDLLLDIAHNDAALQVLADFVQEELLGLADLGLAWPKGKSFGKGMSRLCSTAQRILLINLEDPYFLSADELRQRLQSICTKPTQTYSLAQAMEEAKQNGTSVRPSLVCGSARLVGPAREWLRCQGILPKLHEESGDLLFA